MSEEFYSKIFVKGDCTHAELLSLVAHALPGMIDDWTVVGNDCEVDVRPNEDYSPEALESAPTDFVYFPYTVEVVSTCVECTDHVRTVSALMRAIHDRGMPVVTASDWENTLPGKGRLGI
jgi:hypothetical protein